MDATAVVRRFVAAINNGDVAALGELMTNDHTLQVFDEAPLVGRDANLGAWRGYLESFPGYVIHVHETADRNGVVAVLGHTTGSHLGLPDAEEAHQTLIWLAEESGGAVRTWQRVEDTVETRERVGLASVS
jgi:ketosteroid isomerase-like protein